MESAVSTPQHLSFAARIEADEQRYAALMAQAKDSLARIKEIGDGFGKVREAHDAREDEQAVRAMALLSRIAAEAAETGIGEKMEILHAGGEVEKEEEEEDQRMEGNEQIDREDRMDEEDDGMEMEMGTEDGGPSIPGRGHHQHHKLDDSDFSGLMERAKRLLARISMDGDEPAEPNRAEAAQGAKQMWTEEESDAFWNSM